MLTSFFKKLTGGKFLVFSICLSLSVNLNAQEIEWQNTIGGNSMDYLYSIEQTADGGYILGGASYSTISGDKTENSIGSYDYWIVKTNATGNIQWQNTIGGNDWDQLFSIQQTADGGFILGGTSSSNISGDKSENSNGTFDYWIIKTDSLGIIQWQNTIGGNDWDQLNYIEQTADGGYILGGFSHSIISGDKTEHSNGIHDYWLVKTDSTGNIQWQNTIGGNNWDQLNSVEQTADGGYILGGYSNSNISGDKTENCIGGFGNYDYWIIKTDSLGIIQWQNTIGGNNWDQLNSVEQTTDGGYIFGGRSDSNISGDKTENTNGNSDFWIVKTDATGNIQWQNTIGGSSGDQLQSIKQTSDGGYILGGSSSSNISGDKTENTNGNSDFWIVKTDATGNIQWQNTIGGNGSDELYSIEQTTDSGYIFGGRSDSNVSGDKTENTNGHHDYWIVKICDSLSTASLCSAVSVNELVIDYKEVEVFPNPVIDELTIQLNYTNYLNQPITISIIDVLGNVVRKETTTNPKSPIRNLKSFSPGIYFVEVKTGKEVYRAKFVKE
ncbi:MAG TPA: T9SS type A sorting domain-containing protein [Bacteroidia bacterium]|nr:T9SS type A sorting domain-containing protein [Bacteroidia bacterium]HNU34135.1 T9SS type A sorting domain-containing protein [Bacteroidia bacterium]